VSQKSLLLGGEMSMWSDTYCYIDQCGSAQGSPPVGHALFAPSRDTEFGQSIGGMIWPRGFVGAAAFWNFDNSTDPASPDFVASIYKLSDSLAARGSLVCPTNCSCDQLTACGKPYITSSPAAAGDAVGLAECALPGAPADGQAWAFDGASGEIRLAANASGTSALCIVPTGNDAYPLQLADCKASSSDGWAHLGSGEVQWKASGQCMDAMHTTPHQVGVWECGGEQSQQNQHWAIDGETGTITSLDITDGIAGLCLTVQTTA